MMGLETMLLRVVIAMVLGAIIGIERELAGKAAGIRTDILVATGAAIFTIAGLSMPFLIAQFPGQTPDIISGNPGFLNLIANIVVGVGFLGAGIIVQNGTHVYGVTTAATIWLVAGIGLLAGLGMTSFAVVSTIFIVCLLSFLRHIDIQKIFRKKDN